MVIYIVYREGVAPYPTTLPRVVYGALKEKANRVELWRNEKLIQTFTSSKELYRYLNPKREEEDEQEAEGYEW